MKEELIRVLNTKLDNIKVNIESLTELNSKIDTENGKLSYINGILDNFREDNSYNVLKFTNLSKEDFDNTMDILDSNIKEMFNTNSCNYDGLIYLINGINNGVSLSLTLEQENAINYYIQGMEGKVEEYEAVMDGLMLVKGRFEIDDLNILNEKEKTYENIVKKIENDNYVSETDEILEAINFNELKDEETIEMLIYLLKYNATIHGEKKDTVTIKEEEPQIEFEEPISNEVLEENKGYEEFHFPEFESIETNVVDNTEKEDEVVLPSIENNESKEDIILPNESGDENVFTPPEVSEENVDVQPFPVIDPLPIDDSTVGAVNNPVTSEIEENIQAGDYEEYNIPIEDNKTEDNNQNDLEITSVETSNPTQEVVEEKISTRELKRLFKEFGVKHENNLEDLLIGNIDNYHNILSFLKNNNLLSEFEKNEKLFTEVLTCSTEEELVDIVNIIKNELSVDEDDYKMTLNIAINTIPSIFVKDGGNYENFVRNVKMFKDMGINLISLFDFSKEVFVADHNNLLKNYSVVKNYNINLDYKNLKYMLLLPNIGEKLDFYVESVYQDRTKNNEKFDGITYINNYPNKLNTVQSETIKRLRYSSENSKKVFGNKPNSLAGEISNLKVNVLDISPDYMNKFFDNKFDSLSSDEVREYTKLCRNSSNIGNFTSELATLEEYHNGLRYTINNINVSYNKVVRNYNTLRSYGIDRKKALLFSVCYNLVITVDEYNMIKKVLEERDGE